MRAWIGLGLAILAELWPWAVLVAYCVALPPLRDLEMHLVWTRRRCVVSPEIARSAVAVERVWGAHKCIRYWYLYL